MHVSVECTFTHLSMPMTTPQNLWMAETNEIQSYCPSSKDMNLFKTNSLKILTVVCLSASVLWWMVYCAFTRAGTGSSPSETQFRDGWFLSLISDDVTHWGFPYRNLWTTSLLSWKARGIPFHSLTFLISWWNGFHDTVITTLVLELA